MYAFSSINRSVLGCFNFGGGACLTTRLFIWKITPCQDPRLFPVLISYSHRRDLTFKSAPLLSNNLLTWLIEACFDVNFILNPKYVQKYLCFLLTGYIHRILLALESVNHSAFFWQWTAGYCLKRFCVTVLSLNGLRRSAPHYQCTSQCFLSTRYSYHCFVTTYIVVLFLAITDRNAFFQQYTPQCALKTRVPEGRLKTWVLVMLRLRFAVWGILKSRNSYKKLTKTPSSAPNLKPELSSGTLLKTLETHCLRISYFVLKNKYLLICVLLCYVIYIWGCKVHGLYMVYGHWYEFLFSEEWRNLGVIVKILILSGSSLLLGSALTGWEIGPFDNVTDQILLNAWSLMLLLQHRHLLPFKSSTQKWTVVQLEKRWKCFG